MTSPGIGGPLTETEINIIQEFAAGYPSGVDVDAVEDLLEDRAKNLQILLNQKITNLSPEELMAVQLLGFREESYDIEYLTSLQYYLTEEVINLGAESIQEYDDYFRFKPCIEKIFELKFEKLEKIAVYMREFEQSDYETTSEQYRHKVQYHHNNTSSTNDNGELIAEVLEMYKDIAGLFETTFPNLLALKRILDDETPSNAVLQNKSFSSVCRELLSTEKEPNSVYFDLIVNKYDSNLRNGLSHGDIINDTVNEEVRMPSKSVCYSYAEIGEIGRNNLSNAFFLTGFYRELIKWRYRTYEIEDATRERLDI